MKIRPGYTQTLPYYDSTERGFLLGDDETQVFISKYEAPNNFTEGEELEVFVFYNEDKEVEATTKLPEIQVGQVGCFRVRGVNDIGAFVNIGTRRDILIPNREQLLPLEVDKMALIVLCEDVENQRLFATTKLNRMMQKTPAPYKRGDEVQLMIAEKIEVGRRVIVDGKYLGALFRQEMTDRVRLGEIVKGYVRKVEGKDIIVSMQREGLDLLNDAKAKIMDYLEMNGGYARLSDDTDSEEIKLRLHISKKTFKKAAGMLYKEGKVLLTKFGIKINKTGEIPADAFDEAPKAVPKSVERTRRSESKTIRKPGSKPTGDRRNPKDKPARSFSDREKRYNKTSEYSKDSGEKRNFRENPKPKPSSINKKTDGKKKVLTFKGKKK